MFFRAIHTDMSVKILVFLKPEYLCIRKYRNIRNSFQSYLSIFQKNVSIFQKFIILSYKKSSK